MRVTSWSSPPSRTRFSLSYVPLSLVPYCNDLLMVDKSDLPTAPPDIPKLLTCASPLHPSFDRSVPTYPSEGFDHCQDPDRDVMTLPPFSAQGYLLRYKDCLDAACFELILEKGNSISVSDCLGQSRNTTIGACDRQ